jgi:hypothetical protein
MTQTEQIGRNWTQNMWGVEDALRMRFGGYLVVLSYDGYLFNAIAPMMVTCLMQ